MYEKIMIPDDWGSIHRGSILIKYPAIGDPLDEIDLSNADSFIVYEVYDIKDGMLELRIPESELEEEGLPGNNPLHTGMETPPSTLYRDIDTMIQEGTWWVRHSDIM